MLTRGKEMRRSKRGLSVSALVKSPIPRESPLRIRARGLKIWPVVGCHYRNQHEQDVFADPLIPKGLEVSMIVRNFTRRQARILHLPFAWQSRCTRFARGCGCPTEGPCLYSEASVILAGAIRDIELETCDIESVALARILLRVNRARACCDQRF